MMAEYFAHSLKGKSQKEWQKLEEHLKNVADLANNFAEPFNGSNWAYLAGLLHDIGKYSQEFQHMLIKSSDNNTNMETKVGHPDHSTAGAQAVNQLHANGQGKLIAYAIAGHHCGLLDGKSNKACLEDRLKKIYLIILLVLGIFVHLILILKAYRLSLPKGIICELHFSYSFLSVCFFPVLLMPTFWIQNHL